MVAWDEAEITVTEGGTAMVAVRLSAPADRALRIPLTVTPVQGVLEGVPSAVTFAPGQSRAEFALTAPHDEDAEDAEAMLGFGALPEGVSAGQPAQARVTVVDDDKAAVARFARLNEALLSRQALLLMDDVHFAVGNRLNAFASGQIPGGGLAAGQFSGGGPGGIVSPNGPRGGAFSLGGQSDWTGLFAANARALGEDQFEAAQLLGNSSFVLPLAGLAEGEGDGAGQDESDGNGGITVWGSGNYHSLSNRSLSNRAAGPGWNGEVLDALLGVDLALSPNLLAGVSLSGSVGSFDYEDASDNATGQYESTLTAAHPYLGWASGTLQLWGTAGFGEGEIEIAEAGRSVQRSDTQLRAIAVGGRGELNARDDDGVRTAWNLKSEATAAEVEVHGGGLILPDTVDGSRLRLALERRRDRALADGGMLSSALELGMRHDAGFDIGEGTDIGAELGFGLEWSRGRLTLAARGRSLMGDAVEEWGGNVLVRLAAREDGQGLNFIVQPSWGDTASGVERLWDQGMSGFAGSGPGGADPAGRMMNAEIGYGLMSVGGLVTPYGALGSVGGERSLRSGVRWTLRAGWDVSLEGEQSSSDNRLWLRARWGLGATGGTGTVDAAANEKSGGINHRGS